MLTTGIRLILALIAAAVIGLTGYELRDRYYAAPLTLTVDPMDTADQLARQHRWAETKWLAEFTLEHPALGDVVRAERLSREADSNVTVMRERVTRFVSGAVTGEPTDLFSMLGSLSLDLFVIGDVRDIAVQGWKQMHYGTGDEVVAALSATGLATTLVPHADWAPALLKALKRIGALNERLLHTLKVTSRHALRTGDFRKLSAIVKHIGDVAWKLGPGPLRGAIPAVESAADLSRLSNAAKVNARDAYVLTALFGTRGIRRLRPDGHNVTRLAGSIKMGSRAAKIAKKITGTVGPAWLLLWLGAAMLTLWWTLRPRRMRRNRRNPRRRRIEPVLMATLEPQLNRSADATAYPTLPPLIR